MALSVLYQIVIPVPYSLGPEGGQAAAGFDQFNLPI